MLKKVHYYKTESNAVIALLLMMDCQLIKLLKNFKNLKKMKNNN